MKYEDVVTWMFSKLPMYQNKGKVAFKKDLTNIHLFSEYLNHPEKTFKSVHVAGNQWKRLNKPYVGIYFTRIRL